MGDFEDGPVDFAQALVQLPGLQAETMNYEITTSILSRVTRVYLRGGQMVEGDDPHTPPRDQRAPEVAQAQGVAERCEAGGGGGVPRT